MGDEIPRGQSRTDRADLSSESGWVTTDVAARAVRVSPRTIRRYIDQGKIEAKPQGEGVRREWLVSVDSLHALRATRASEEQDVRADRASDADFSASGIADVLREMAARLERRAEEAAELRVRLELTEQAQSTLDQERRRALHDFEEARLRLEEVERERDEFRQELETLKESIEEVPDSAEAQSDSSTSYNTSGEAQADINRPAERSWWRRMFGG